MRLLTLPVLLIASMLAACSTTDPLTQRLATTPVQERAYMIGSYAVTCKPNGDKCHQAFNSLSVSYHMVSNHQAWGELESATGKVFGDDTVHDFIDLDRQEKGFYFCVPLPPGDYEFVSYDFYNYAGGGSGYSLRKDQLFALPLKLEAGEVAYIGRLKLTTTIGKNLLGMPLNAPGILLLSEGTAESQAAALKKCPSDVRAKPVRDAKLPLSAAKGNPMVQAER